MFLETRLFALSVLPSSWPKTLLPGSTSSPTSTSACRLLVPSSSKNSARTPPITKRPPKSLRLHNFDCNGSHYNGVFFHLIQLADDRAQKVQAELKHTVDVLHEEQERIVKIESIKKALEVEIKNLTIRLEEVETNALVSSKRIISKLEARVRFNLFFLVRIDGA